MAIGFMSFGGMLTGGDEEIEVSEVRSAEVEKTSELNTENIAQNETLEVSEITPQ